VIAVTSANAVGGLIDLRELQERCKIGDIDHKYATHIIIVNCALVVRFRALAT
jgi:hypothetical protein